MEEDTKQPAKPDIPSPSIPKPDLPVPPAEPAAIHTTPVVNVRIRDADADDTPKTGAAPFNTRVAAGIIDMIISIGLTGVSSSVLPHFAQKVAFLIGVAYLLTRDSLPFLGGQSVGKKVMKLRAVTLDGKPLTGNWEAGILRNLILIPCAGLIEFVVLLIREGKPEMGKRLGDEWAKTKVIVDDSTPAG